MSTNSIQLNEKRYSLAEMEAIIAAEELAAKLHGDQKRRSGEPYLVHPVAVAQTLIDWGMDAETVMAGLLHDTVEDTEMTLPDIQKRFGDKVAELVDGVTKLENVDQRQEGAWSGQRGAASSENIRKLLLATTKDLRVLIIKLADVRHNLQTLKYLPPENQRRFAQESLEIYAALADRLGMGQLKAEIEDLSFRYVDPEAFAQLKRQMAGYTKSASRYLAKVKRFIGDEFKAAGVELISIEGREKHLYSVHKKLAKAEGDFDKIYDLVAIRIIVPEVSDCYKALGILHQHFKPLIYRIKDYIAVPKPNGYRSLHTTVFALDGRITEIQIRTPQMHDEAEHGLAAHFYYDAQKQTKGYLSRQSTKLPEKLSWVNKLSSMDPGEGSGQEFIESLKVDLFQDRIFVSSPKGDLFDLPEGATPIDLAFSVHTNIGLRAGGAKVNGRMVPLDHKLENRDVVEILTRRASLPSRDWLNFVKTPHAKSRIRSWFRAQSREANIASGRHALEPALKAFGFKHLEELPEAKVAELLDELHIRDLDALMAAIGEGTLPVAGVTRRLFPEEKAKPEHANVVKRAVSTGRVEVAGGAGLPYQLAPCCKPTFPVPITGYITRGSGITVHSQGCHNLPQEAARLMDCAWETAGEKGRLLCRLEVTANNRVGLLHDLTGVVSSAGINLNGVTSEPIKNRNEAVITLGVEVGDLYELANLIKKIEHLADVLNVKKVG